MFQSSEHALTQAGGSATLAIKQPAQSIQFTPAGLVHRIRVRLAAADLTVDLGSRIGSLHWFRGAATCAALCWSAVHFAPGFGPLATPAAPAMRAAQWQESRALALAPIAFGSDTGRRMAATAAVQPLAGSPERPTVDLAATIGLGDGFAHVLTRAGVAAADAERITAMVAGAIPIASLKPGTRIDMTLGRRSDESKPRPVDFLRLRAAFDLKLAVSRVDGALRLVREPIAVDTTPLRISGVVGRSLFHSAREAGVPSRAIAEYLRVIAKRMRLNQDVAATARFDMVVAQRRAATGEVELGQLLYAGLDQGPKQQLRVLRWTSAGQDDWFDPAGIGSVSNRPLMPVNGVLTSSFGMRMHPILGYSRMHQGIDIGAAYGSPIVSAISGTVTFAGRHAGDGNFVQIYSSKQFGTGYAHMSRMAVRVGDTVRRGQIIGYVGSTGLSTGSHLHYEVYLNGKPVNPMSINIPHVDQLTGPELGQFRARMVNLLMVRPAGTMTSPVRSVALVMPKVTTRRPVTG